MRGNGEIVKWSTIIETMATAGNQIAIDGWLPNRIAKAVRMVPTPAQINTEVPSLLVRMICRAQSQAKGNARQSNERTSCRTLRKAGPLITVIEYLIVCKGAATALAPE